MSDEVNTSRRRFLVGATSAVGAAGAVGVAVPFLGSWQPSAKAKAAGAPVKKDLSKLQPGEMITVEWRGKPVYVVRRTEEQLKNIEKLSDQLKDPASEVSAQPDYIEGAGRAINPEYGIFVGLCTHLGCAPKQQFEVGIDPRSGTENGDWYGGFFCPCHGSIFDLSGRVYKGVPASANLEVPPYRFVTDTMVIIGEDGGAA